MIKPSKKKPIQEQLKAYYQKREEYEAESLRLKQSRQTLQYQLSDTIKLTLGIDSSLSDLEKQIELARLESQQVARVVRKIKMWVNSLEVRLQVLRTSWKKNKPIQRVFKKNYKMTSSSGRSGERVGQFSLSEDPDQVIDYLREKYVALMQDEAERSNELTTIENQLEASAQLSQSKKEDFLTSSNRKRIAGKDQVAQEAYQVAQEHLKHLLETYQSEAKRFEEARQAYQEAQAKMFDLLVEVRKNRLALTV